MIEILPSPKKQQEQVKSERLTMIGNLLADVCPEVLSEMSSLLFLIFDIIFHH